MRYIPLKSLAALGLLLASLVAAGSACAQIPVTDGAHIGINNFAWIEQQRQMVADELNQIRQIEHQVSQIQNQIQDIREQQVNGLKIESPLGQRRPLPQRRGENDFVDERCSSLGESGLSRLFEGVSGGSQRVIDARRRQFMACVLLVRTENQRFNYMIDFSEKLQEIDRDLVRLQAETNSTSGSERGRLARNTNSWSNLSTKQAQEIQVASEALKLLDQQISVLKAEMAQAGRTAFNNKSSSLMGQVIQYGTLKVALEGARRARER